MHKLASSRLVWVESKICGLATLHKALQIVVEVIEISLTKENCI